MSDVWSMGSGMKKTLDRSSGGRNRMTDICDVFPLYNKDKPQKITIRLIGKPFITYEYNVQGLVSKKGNEYSMTYLSPSVDPATGQLVGKCPFAEAGLKPRIVVWQNAIIRKFQEDEPRKQPKHTKEEKEGITIYEGTDSEEEVHVKEKDSASWTPVRAVKLSPSIAKALFDIQEEMNTKKMKSGEVKVMPVDDPKYGFDFTVKCNPDPASPSDTYRIYKKEGRSPLTEEEEGYLLQNIWAFQLPTGAEAAKNVEYLKNSLPDLGGGKAEVSEGKTPYLNVEEEEEEKPKKKKGKALKEYDDLDDEDLDDDDEEEEKPKKKKKPLKKKGKKLLSKKRKH